LELNIPYMRKLLAAWLLFPALSYAQPIVSGTINQYAAVTNINYCSAILTVNNAAPFAPGGRVLLIQMKGALINGSNTPAFGTVNDPASSGLYESATVQSVVGNEVRLEFLLVNSYNLTGNVQLVSVPQFTDVTVTGTLTAPAWNGSTGGVLAMEVSGQLSLQADIDLSGRGFRGGISQINQTNNCSWLTNQNGWFYPLDNWRGAAKGEGISAFIAGAEAGRGPQANGGGGGNDHNSGGGGGANFGAGGQGGTNNEPATFGCNGNFPGAGGRAAPGAGPHLYMGGGGGAGHENNSLGTDGGAGGGIVLILAGSIVGNGRKILANGLSSGNALSDGAGGGGAGGTIAVAAGSATGVEMEARGGNGGNVNNANANRCMGPGGGGAGGRIIVPAGTAASVSAGQAGQTQNSTSCATGTNGAQAGQAGQISFEPLVLPEGDQPIAAPAFVQQPAAATACPGDSILLSASVSGNALNYQWQVNTGGGFQNITDNNTYAGSQTPTLLIRNIGANFSGYQYRLVVTTACYPSTTSQVAALSVSPAAVATFSFVVMGNAVQFQNTSQNGSTFLWNFGDGNSSTAAMPLHTYASGGSYTVSLIATNACNADTVTLTVQLSNPPSAGITATPTTGCAPLSVAFSSASSAGADTYQWFFPGGSPASSPLPSLSVTYNAPGSYGVTLVVANAAGTDTLEFSNYIEVTPEPLAAFTVQPAGGLVFNFVNSSQNATNYQWNFGDGNSSAAANPSHTYATPGVYTVLLTASNACGSATFTIPVIAGQTPTAVFAQSATEGCAPMLVQFSDESSGFYTSRQWSFPGGNPAVSDLATPSVIYTAPGIYNVTLSLDGPLGASSITRTAAVQAYAFPQPAFTFSVQGLTVTFTNNSVNASSYSWLLGDGNSSQAVSPVHTYGAPGVYTVTLNAERPFCASATSATVNLLAVATTASGGPEGFRLFPNPVSETLYLEWKEEQAELSHYRLFNAAGIPVEEGSFGRQQALNMASRPAGLYILELHYRGVQWRGKVVSIR
jgi:PKD repeat protein